MRYRTPPSLRRLCRDVLPMLHRAARGGQMIETVKAIVATDRWNSFDRFHDTTQALVRAYEDAGARVEVEPIQTGGSIGSGRWVIQEAADVRSGVVDVVRPVRRRVLDYAKNPWHVVQWSAATPAAGVTGPLVILDDAGALERFAPGELRGKTLLTRLNPRPLLRRLADLGVAVVIADQPVPNLPDAVAWTRFGWGGLPIANASARVVGLAVSANQGRVLRRLHDRHGSLTLRTKVDVRRYVGTHDVVCGLIEGRDDPQDEVWALAHGAEPGAVDNASGVATCVEIARMLGELIAGGKLQPPRRSIRLLNAFECHGFFAYLERVPRFQPPLAGVDIDEPGLRPDLGDRLEWHATIPTSAGFVDRVGEPILRAVLRIDNPGYHYARRPFVSTSDTLIGDPKYGFPCPWLTVSRDGAPPQFDAYHSSADVPALLSGRGLRLAAAAMGAYLYYLADADSTAAVELADAEADHFERELRRTRSPRRKDSLREQYRVSVDRLRRWLWGGDRKATVSRLTACDRRIDTAAGRRRRRLSRRGKPGRVPRRTAPLTVFLENTPEPIARRIREASLPDWAVFWADGQRTLADVADALTCECGKPVTVDRVDACFRAHAEMGYVELIEPGDAVTREWLVRDLRRLGLRRGMDVMVHSSLSKIGHVVGGAEAVVDALLDAIGPAGTLLMPSFNHGSARVFNPMATPTTNGAIPQAMWRRPDAVRSLHPTHSVAAIGPKAEPWCRDHLKVGIWAPDSPIGRLVHGGGYLLCLGVTHTMSTAYHVAEMAVPCRCIDPFGNVERVVLPDGRVHEVPALVWRSQTCPVPPAKLDETLDRRRRQRHGRVGRARATLVKANDLWQTRIEHLRHVCPTCPVRPEIRPRRAR